MVKGKVLVQGNGHFLGKLKGKRERELVGASIGILISTAALGKDQQSHQGTWQPKAAVSHFCSGTELGTSTSSC